MLVAHFIPLFNRLSSSHNTLPLRTRILHTLVKSCITNEDSTNTRQVMPYSRGLHIHSSSHALRTRTPQTLVKSCLTHEDSTYTRQVMHYERGLHIHSSSQANENSAYTRQVMHYARVLHIHSSSEDPTCIRQVRHYELVDVIANSLVLYLPFCSTLNKNFFSLFSSLFSSLHIDSSGHA